MLSKAIVLLLITASLTTSYHTAKAQDSTAAAAARLLYDEARGLLKAERYEDACPKLEHSLSMNQTTDTKFWLADCYEHIGRPSTAWQLFRETADESKAEGNDKKTTYARERAQALMPRLSRLRVSVPAEVAVPGLEIKRDGKSIDEVLWKQDIPVDPGDYLIRAEAPGKKPWEGRWKVEEGSVVIVTIPVLVDAPKEATPGPNRPADPPPVPVVVQPPDRRDWRFLGPATGAGAVGLAGVAAGTAFGLSAMSQWSEAQEKCSIATDCYPDSPASKLAQQAARSATGANIAFAIGGGALVVAGVLLYLGLHPVPAGTSSSLSILPVIGPDGARLSVQVSF